MYKIGVYMYKVGMSRTCCSLLSTHSDDDVADRDNAWAKFTSVHVPLSQCLLATGTVGKYLQLP